ncbi:hypothetical protein MMC07_000527 [Pseudocyphellaria aurata]|nr:hypothetical protein [Pseudocyphellaria aurata]
MPKGKPLGEIEADESEDSVRSPSKRLRRRPSFSISTDDATDELAGTKRQSPSKPNRITIKSNPVPSASSKITDDSSEDVVVTPRRRLRRRNASSPKIDSEGSEERAADIREDLKDLRDSGGFSPFFTLLSSLSYLWNFSTNTNVEIRESRTRGKQSTPKKGQKQKRLEMLRRHHARDKTILSSDNDASSDNGQDASGEDDDIDSGTEAVRRSLLTNVDEYEKDFVDDDDVDGNLGAPHALEAIPLEFTSYASKKPIEYFKIAVQWMVHNKLNPAFARDAVVYQIAARKLDDEVQGFAGSKFVSSAWKNDFTKALKSRPDIMVRPVGVRVEQKCEACQRGGHPATYQVTFQGKPYNRDTLESASEDEDDEDGEDEDEYQVFYLGRNCKENAETAHSLHHWRMQLNTYVLNWLGNNGHLSPEKILEHAQWNNKKRENYSNAVVDGMEESGEMRILYRDFKHDLDAARSAKTGKYGNR